MNKVSFYILIFISNLVVGATVWSLIDSEDRRLYNWYNRCPPWCAWWVQPLILTLWPIVFIPLTIGYLKGSRSNDS